MNKIHIPIGKRRFVVVEIPTDLKFQEIPKLLIRIGLWLKAACSCNLD